MLEIARATAAAAGHSFDEVLLTEPAVGGEIGQTPWSTPKPFLVDMAKAEAELGYRPAVSWADALPRQVEWLIAATRGRDWREVLTRGANYLRFDYEAEDAFSRRLGRQPRTEARSTRSSPMRRVTPSASKRSSSSCDCLPRGAEQVAEARQRDSFRGARARRPALRAPARSTGRDRVPVADADEPAAFLEEAGELRALDLHRLEPESRFELARLVLAFAECSLAPGR